MPQFPNGGYNWTNPTEFSYSPMVTTKGQSAETARQAWIMDNGASLSNIQHSAVAIREQSERYEQLARSGWTGRFVEAKEALFFGAVPVLATAVPVNLIAWLFQSVWSRFWRKRWVTAAG